MNTRESLQVLAFVLPAAFATYLLFRRCDRDKFASRSPIFLVVIMVVFLAGITMLPAAVPGIFTHVIGHPVTDMYQFPPDASGVREAESWWVARWVHPIQWVMLGSVVMGMTWALVNIAHRRKRLLNAAVLLLALLWVGWSAYTSLACFPVCF
jgi:hypothetical protein